jgi:hypothetical protein
MYISHDFGKYEGKDSDPGLHSANWNTSGHEIVCDIIELPEDIADFFMCTEVLEHVPDPVQALIAIARAARASSHGLITVPFTSRMHQAPYWFSLGLSPYWFHYHAHKAGFEIIEIKIIKDFIDVLIQEVSVVFARLHMGWLASKTLKIISPILRMLCTRALLESSAFSTYVLLKKTSH